MFGIRDTIILLEWILYPGIDLLLQALQHFCKCAQSSAMTIEPKI